MERHVWTDERLDDMVDRLDKNIDLLRSEMQAGFARMEAQFARTNDDLASLRGELLDLNKRMAAGFTRQSQQMLQAVLVISGMLVAAMVTILAKAL